MVKKGKRDVGFSSFRGMNIFFYFILSINSRALAGIIAHFKAKHFFLEISFKHNRSDVYILYNEYEFKEKISLFFRINLWFSLILLPVSFFPLVSFLIPGIVLYTCQHLPHIFLPSQDTV